MPRAENVDFQVVIDVTKNAYSFCKNSHLNSEINLAIATPTGATHPSRAQSWCQARQSWCPILVPDLAARRVSPVVRLHQPLASVTVFPPGVILN